jgi:hypothetical protein
MLAEPVEAAARRNGSASEPSPSAEQARKARPGGQKEVPEISRLPEKAPFICLPQAGMLLLTFLSTLHENQRPDS